jgi:hypothetical protein
LQEIIISPFVSIAGLADWRQAQQQLHTVLRHCMRPEIPRGIGKLASLGDVGFVGPDPRSDVPTSVYFTRGNACLSVSSAGERSVDVSENADQLDRALHETAEKNGRGKGTTRSPIPGVITVKAGEKKVVIENLPGAAAQEFWLKIVAPEGEFCRKGDTLVYISPNSGKKQIAAYAMRTAWWLTAWAAKRAQRF